MNPAAADIFSILGIGVEDFGRSRDIYLNEQGTKIFVFTRNGHEDYDYIEEDLKKHSHYVRSWRDDFDNTYRTYEFNVPEEHLGVALGLAEVTDTVPPMDRFKKLISDLKSGKKNEQVDRAMEVGKAILGQIDEISN